MGRRKRPFYRIVAIDSRTRRDGPEFERLGWFDPLKTDVAVELKEDRVIHWLEQGAQLSEKVNTIFSSTGLQYKLHLMREGKSEEEIAAALIEWRLGQDEKQARKAEKKLAKKKASAPVVEEVADGEASPAEESVEKPVAEEAQDAKSDDSQVEGETPVVAEESEEVKASEEPAVEAETSDDTAVEEDTPAEESAEEEAVAEESEEVKASEEPAVEEDASDDAEVNVEEPAEEKPAETDEIKANELQQIIQEKQEVLQDTSMFL